MRSGTVETAASSHQRLDFEGEGARQQEIAAHTRIERQRGEIERGPFRLADLVSGIERNLDSR